MYRSRNVEVKVLDLKFRLDDLTAEGIPVKGVLAEEMVRGCIEGLVGSLGYTPVGSAQASGTAYRTEGDEVIVSGMLEAKVAFQCVRCLKALEANISSRNDYVFVRKTKAYSGDDALTVTDEDDGSDALTFEGDEINLEETFRQELMLALPMNPTCEHSEGTQCQGEASLGPTEAGDSMDPRWAPLLELKKKLNSEQ